jgi:hypothetical protein
MTVYTILLLIFLGSRVHGELEVCNASSTHDNVEFFLKKQTLQQSYSLKLWPKYGLSAACCRVLAGGPGWAGLFSGVFPLWSPPLWEASFTALCAPFPFPRRLLPPISPPTTARGGAGSILGGPGPDHADRVEEEMY